MDITELGIDLRSGFNRRPACGLLILQGDFGWQGGKRFPNVGLTNLRYVHDDSEWFLPEAFATWVACVQPSLGELSDVGPESSE